MKVFTMSKEIQEIQKKIRPILRQHGVVRASVFGSFAKNEAKKDSDLDLLIEFEDKKRKTLLDMAALRMDLEQALDIKVDLLTFCSLHPLIRDSILREQVAIL
jgi:hypothetical protein